MVDRSFRRLSDAERDHLHHVSDFEVLTALAGGTDPAQIGRLTVPSINGPVRIDNIARVERGQGRGGGE